MLTRGVGLTAKLCDFTGPGSDLLASTGSATHRLGITVVAQSNHGLVTGHHNAHMLHYTMVILEGKPISDVMWKPTTVVTKGVLPTGDVVTIVWHHAQF